jgi:uncharacterized protein YijF (DUF1287 family)
MEQPDRRRIVRRVLTGAAILVIVFLALPIGWAGVRWIRQAPEYRFLRQWSAAYSTHRVTADADGSTAQTAAPTFFNALAHAAAARTGVDVRYDPAYVALDYPNGDVAPDRGVCTDLVVRAYRDMGIDLQRLVHEDMQAAFDRYPTIWGSSTADPNIDHRRVPNLMVFFQRHGEVLPVTDDPADYRPGDIVTWHLGGGLTHIGIVTEAVDPDSGRPLIAHHVGGLPSEEDVLFWWEIIGHFRYPSSELDAEAGDSPASAPSRRGGG